jgi:hypothetical protein
VGGLTNQSVHVTWGLRNGDKRVPLDLGAPPEGVHGHRLWNILDPTIPGRKTSVLMKDAQDSNPRPS